MFSVNLIEVLPLVWSTCVTTLPTNSRSPIYTCVRNTNKPTIYYLDFIYCPYVLQPQRFKGWFFPHLQVKPTLLGPVDRASLYRWTLWLKNIRTVDKVHIIDRSNTAPSWKRLEMNQETCFQMFRFFVTAFLNYFWTNGLMFKNFGRNVMPFGVLPMALLNS
jgi:hypothetical protein